MTTTDKWVMRLMTLLALISFFACVMMVLGKLPEVFMFSTDKTFLMCFTMGLVFLTIGYSIAAKGRAIMAIILTMVLFLMAAAY